MKLTYVLHSCFVVESDVFTLIFDFYKDSTHEYIAKNLLDFPGKIYVFSSHAHRDHFNPEILKWKSIRPDIQYILSKDIVDDGLYDGTEAFIIDKLETYSDECIHVKSFGSTDKGVSFRVSAQGKTIFHAGDLNNWHWNRESTEEEIREAEDLFHQELDLLAQETKQLDVCMFPIDHRLGEDYTKGAEQLLELVKVNLFVPMHFWEHYHYANDFARKVEKTGCKFWQIHQQEDSIYF
ncbi:MAG: MBL fold metallo-hydrolase [Dysgonamonadaceae bacterium]